MVKPTGDRRERGDMSKRVVVWGTGFVGKMVIAEIVKHPVFELVGVGVSNPEKVGRDVGEICGLGASLGLTATDDVDALIALQARRAGPLRPHRGARRRQHRAHHPVPAGGHRRVLDVDDAVGVAGDAPEPAELDRADHRGLRGGPVVVLHHRHRPRLRQRPVPDDADGPVLRGPHGAGLGAAGLHQLRGRLRVRDGHRQAARAPAAAGEPGHPRLRLGRNGSDDRARRGHRTRRDHHHLGQVGDARRDARRPRASSRRATSPPCGSPSTASTTARPASSSST